MRSCSRDSPKGSGPMVRVSHPVLALDPPLCLGVHRKSLKPSKYSHAGTVLYSFFCGWNNNIALSPLIFKILGYKYLLKSILHKLLFFYCSFPVWSAKVLSVYIFWQSLHSVNHPYYISVLSFILPPSPVPPGELDVFDRQAGDQHTTKQPCTAETT